MGLSRSKVDPLQPFKSLAIPEVIYEYWGLDGREQASIFTCIEEFKKVPNNLIALTCSAVCHLILCSRNSYLIFGACYYRLSVR